MPRFTTDPTRVSGRTPVLPFSRRKLALLGAILFVGVAVPVATVDLTPGRFGLLVFGTVGGYLLGFLGMALSVVYTRDRSEF